MSTASALRPRQSFGQAPDWPSRPLVASAEQMFGPRAVCRLSCGALYAADTGHHRLLCRPAQSEGWQVIGQPEITTEARNAGADPHACSFSTPVGLCGFGPRGLVVADSWNHRVLIWHQAPHRHGQCADLVLGQADFSGSQGNRGRDRPDAHTLFWPSGVYCDGERLIVADTGNRRVLIWQQLPQYHGQAADLVLGQPDMHHRDQNAGGDLDRHGMVWPHAVALWQGDLVVSDAGANRIMQWSGVPPQHGRACQRILGQSDDSGRLHNQGHAKPSARSLAMPYALAVWRHILVVADSANSRLLFWDKSTGSPEAFAVHGQPDFSSAGDNRWQAPADDSLCWPYGLAVDGDELLIADTGNNRLQIWSLPELLADG